MIPDGFPECILDMEVEEKISTMDQLRVNLQLERECVLKEFVSTEGDISEP